MAIDPRALITNDKAMPEIQAGDAGKLIQVNSTEDGLEVGGSAAITGEIKMWILDTAPAGYLICNGATKNYDEYPALGALLGGAPGGTFTLPNINFAKNSKGTNTLNTEAASVGTHGHTANALGTHSHSITVNSVANHGHTATSNTTGAHTHSLSGGVTVGGSSLGPGGGTRGDTAGQANSDGAHKHTISVTNAGAHGHTASSAGVSAGTPTINNHTGTNQPACTLVNFIIKT